MQRKFQYIMMGAGLTLLTIFGALTLLLPQARAEKSEPVTASGAVIIESVPANTLEGMIAEPSSVENNSVNSGKVDNHPAFQLTDAVEHGTTEMNIVVYTVETFSEKRKDDFLGKSGWLHIQSEFIIPDEQKGNGYHLASSDEILPMDRLVPNMPIFETWYHFDEAAQYDQAISLVSAPDGTIYQQSVLFNDKWANITLKEAGVPSEQYLSSKDAVRSVLPVEDAFQQLESALTWKNVTIQSEEQDQLYIVTVYTPYDQPITDAAFITEAVIGSSIEFVFDSNTGQLLSKGTTALLDNGTSLATGTWTYLTVDFSLELPVETSELLNDAIINLTEEK